MNLTKEQFDHIKGYFPRQRGNVKIDNFTFISAILYMAENGCKWRALPEKFGNWNSVYRRFERWAETGVIQRIFAAMQVEEILAVHVEILALDSTSCKAHPNAHGALKKRANNPSVNPRVVGTPSFMWYPQMIRSSLRCTSRAENVTTRHKDASR
jgi:transposase